jgi:hypothetical protein
MPSNIVEKRHAIYLGIYAKIRLFSLDSVKHNFLYVVR